MAVEDKRWQRVGDAARARLSRHRDPWTVRECDDLVQESLLHVWRWSTAAPRSHSVVSAVRTIAWRMRCRGLRGKAGQRVVADSPAVETATVQLELAGRTFRVHGESIASEWLAEQLHTALARLPSFDRTLLLGHGEGFSMAELALRYGCSPGAAKARVCRARKKLRRALERAVRLAHPACADSRIPPKT